MRSWPLITLGSVTPLSLFILGITLESEATSTVDMLRAARQAAQLIGARLENRLFLTGYSQGGHVTMALHRYLEQNLSSEFSVIASAPISGPYNLDSHFLYHLNNNPASTSRFILAYMIVAMDSVYHLFGSLDEAIQPQVVQRIPQVFDGTHDLSEMPGFFPDTNAELLQPGFENDVIADSGNWLGRQADNEVYNWKPMAPVNLIYGESDINVNPELNSIFAFKQD